MNSSFITTRPVLIFVFCCQKKGLIEKVLLHNICFGLEIGKIIFDYAFLSRDLHKCGRF